MACVGLAQDPEPLCEQHHPAATGVDQEHHTVAPPLWFAVVAGYSVSRCDLPPSPPQWFHPPVVWYGCGLLRPFLWVVWFEVGSAWDVCHIPPVTWCGFGFACGGSALRHTTYSRWHFYWYMQGRRGKYSIRYSEAYSIGYV